MDGLSIGREVFQKEIFALQNVEKQLGDTFNDFLTEIMDCSGKIIFIGMGKSGHIAKKIAASMSSLGTCAICLHPAECMHGDLGMIQANDLVIMISYSGESEEMIRIIPGIKLIGAALLGITCNHDSTLARACKITQVMEGVQEACRLGLAPTSSTTAVLVYGDALAVAASSLKDFQKNDFGRFHPAGSLGKKLITRSVDLMHHLKESSFISLNASFYEAIQAMIETDTDLIMVVDQKNQLIGILTNGDIKRNIADKSNIMTASIKEIVHRYPFFVDDSSMAVDALKIMSDNHVHAIPIVKNNKPIGVIEKRDILKYGIYL